MWFFRHISYSLAEGRTSINLIIHTRALLSRWQFLRLRRLLIHDIPLIPYPGSLLVTICAVKQLIIFHLHGAALFPPLTGAPWNTSYSRAYAPSTPSQHHHHHYTPPHTTTPHYTPPHTTTHHYTPPHITTPHYTPPHTHTHTHTHTHDPSLCITRETITASHHSQHTGMPHFTSKETQNKNSSLCNTPCKEYATHLIYMHMQIR